MEDTKKQERRKKYSIERGYGRLKVKDAKIVRAEIMNTLGIVSPNSWINCLYGYSIPTMEKVENINAIFAKYGIKGNIWGLEAEAVTELETSKSE